MKKDSIYLLLLLFFIPSSFAQKITHINTLNGLSNNTVISIIQDRQGYYWFGTDDGLNKYDGYSFTVFKPDFMSENSISHSIAKALFEDSKGNIWIGTDGGGLNCFSPETESFKNYYCDLKTPGSLSHNNVSAIAEDKDHIIWVATYGGGLNKLDPATGEFTSFKNEVNNPKSLSSNYINCLLVDKNNYLWIGTWGRGLDRFDIGKQTFLNFHSELKNSNSLSNSTVNCLYKDELNNLWIGTWGGGLELFHPENNTFEHFNSGHDNMVVRSISSDRKGFLWIGTYGNGLFSFDRKNKTFRQYNSKSDDPESLSNDNIWTIFYSNDQKIWTGNIDGGINQMNLAPERFHTMFSNFDVNTIIETKSSNYIIGTSNNGLFLIDPFFSIKEHFKSNNSSSSLANNNVSCILEDRFGVFWIATQDGLSTYNPVTRKFKNYKQAFYTYKCISFNAITDIFEDHLGTIWVATWGGGLNRYNRASDDFDYYLNFKKVKVAFYVDMTRKTISKDGVHIAGSMNGWNPALDELKPIKDNIYGITMLLYPVRMEYKFLNGKTWGTEEKVPVECAENTNRIVYPGNQDIELEAVLFGKSCNKVAKEPLAVDLESSESVLSSNHIYTIFEDRQGILWVGTNNGLNKYNRDEDKFTKYQNRRGDTTSLTDNHVNTIFEDHNGTLWLGTLGGGLNKFDQKNNAFKGFTEKDGLANNNIRAITEDNEGNLWLSTNTGITKFNIKNEKFRNYDSKDGINENGFHSRAVIYSKQKSMYFGGTNGLISFNPGELTVDTIAPKIYITDLYVANKRVAVGKLKNGNAILRKALPFANSIKLSYKNNIITFYFTAIHFTAPEKNSFAYKLEGFDKEWIYVDAKHRFATYTNLDGGNYTFLVKACNSDGIWNEEPAQLHIKIVPPFWKQSWFIACMILIAAYGVYYWYNKKILNKQKSLMQEQVLNEKKIIELEKSQLQLEVDLKNAELAAVTTQMLHKSQMIIEQIKRVKTVMNTANANTKEKLGRLVSKLNNELNHDKDWEYLQLHFDKAHQDFIQKLKTNYPQLHASDIRMAAYIRMGLSTKEISELMNITLRGVESRRFRLRKSFDLKSGDNLSDFIFSL